MATLTGSAGDDVIVGTARDDYILGLDGNDTLIGGAGGDYLDGGDGSDTASYANAAGAVYADLDAGYGVGYGNGAGDTYYSIENLTGSAFNDQLYGDGGDNVLTGGAGADYLYGGGGSDTASYADAAGAVYADLGAGYGVGYGNGAGDTYYSIENLTGSAFNDQLYGDGGDNVLTGGAGADYLYGGGGSDTASYADAAGAVYANLGAGYGFGDGNDTYYSIENLTGSAFNDQLYGDGGDNVLMGGAGADYLYGGGGSDTASYANATGAVYADLGAGVGYGGDAAGDAYDSIENLTGSVFNDLLVGDANDNVLTGGAGADYLYGGGGSDTASYANAADGVYADLDGGLGYVGDATNDTYNGIENLTGSAFNDALIGDANDNVLMGGAGGDYLVGGSGSDTASYANAAHWVYADLAAGYGSVGDAAGDTYDSIENLIGGTFNDMLFGDANDNVLMGGTGADYLAGGGGSDTASYANAAGGVYADLDAGYGSAGDAWDDTYDSIENLTGSAFDDWLIGDANDNVLTGGAGGDYLAGGAGNDTASYANSTGGVTADLEYGIGYGSDAMFDVYNSIENLTGSVFNDALIGDAGNNVLTGGGGYDIYVSGLWGGQDRIVNGTAANTQASGELDFGAGISTDQLWFARTGNDLVDLGDGQPGPGHRGRVVRYDRSTTAGDRDGGWAEDRHRPVAAGAGDGVVFSLPCGV